MSGVYASLDGLVSLRYAAQSLSLIPRHRGSGMLAGHRRSNVRGRGIEFAEVRQYQAGDEVRSIDWRVTARTGEPHTRVYHEERERPILVLIDQRPTMFFGSRKRFKSVQALNCAATLTWAALAGGDRVGGLVVGASKNHEIRPRKSRRSVLRLLNRALEANLSLDTDVRASQPLSLSDAIQKLQRIARPGSAAFLISDFHDWDEKTHEQFTLLARHCEVAGLNISDGLERELPPSGRYHLSDGFRSFELDSGSAVVHRSFKRHTAQHESRLQTDFISLGAKLIDVDCTDDALAVLHRHFTRRQRVRQR